MSAEFKALGSYAGPEIADSGLLLYLDANNTKSYPGSGTAWYDLSGNGNHFTIYNGVTYSNGALVFDGVNDYASSDSNINFTSLSSVTIEIWLKCTNTVDGMAFEHTANWNTNAGGLGLYTNSTGGTQYTNLLHTNHNTEIARNYLFAMGTTWNSHVNIYSIISDATGRLTYTNGASQSFAAISYDTTTTTSAGGSFANSKMYLASRGGTGAFLNCSISAFKIYNYKQTAAQIAQSYSALRGRYGL
jgi:hypothetical protein